MNTISLNRRKLDSGWWNDKKGTSLICHSGVMLVWPELSKATSIRVSVSKTRKKEKGWHEFYIATNNGFVTWKKDSRGKDSSKHYELRLLFDSKVVLATLLEIDYMDLLVYPDSFWVRAVRQKNRS